MMKKRLFPSDIKTELTLYTFTLSINKPQIRHRKW